ncbi:MAG: threonine synthase [Myxococcota bacterium]|jgi:threonine synthase
MLDSHRPLLTQPASGASLGLAAPEAPDPALSLADRVAAFEDVADSLVGDSLFTRARNIERLFGISQLWLKFEGDNPTGTQKDRIAFAQVADALHRGFSTVTVATCGNYGVATALACSHAGLECVVVIPEGNHTRRVIEMHNLRARVQWAAGTYEDSVDASQALARDNGWYDANPGGANERVQLQGYATIADEVADQLGDAPAIVAVPVSNGTTLAGVHRGFERLHRRGKTSRIPRMVGGSAWRKNPVVHAFRTNLARCPELPVASIRETAVNEPLINWRSIDGDPCLAAIRLTSGHAADATDKQMKQMSALLRDQQALHVLPASTAGLIALLDLHAKQTLPPDRYVVVLTGRYA